MKFFYISIFLFSSLVFSQVSEREIKELKQLDMNSLTNEQLDLLRKRPDLIPVQNPASKSINDIKSNDVYIKPGGNIESTEPDNYFGYNYFKRDISFFDNIPTPADFRLGPGDEIVISLWGETNDRLKFTINKNGNIFYSNVGFISLSNLTILEAESLLTNKLKNIYSTLENESTQLVVELSKIKSINIYFSGQVDNPGIHLIHPFSDVFAAITQAGGIKKNGSLRNVNLIRSNKVVAKIDFYEFFSTGINNFNNIKLLDGDVIHIPAVSNRVEINGEVINPGYYETLENNSLFHLIQYAGGLTSTASTKVILNEINPFENRSSDDIATTGSLIDLSNASSIFLKNGAEVNLLPIQFNRTNVTVVGKVKAPGAYPISKKIFSENKQISTSSSLKNVLDAAGGFNDPVYRKSLFDEVIVLRLDENKFYSNEITVNYKDSSNFNLNVDDIIFVYENNNYLNKFMFSISGEVNKPGSYPFVEGYTVQDAINLAGGLTPLGSSENLLIKKSETVTNLNGERINQTELVGNADLDFLINDKDEINIFPNTSVIRVFGNVYNPGFIAHSGGRLSMANAIELAGGYKPNSLRKKSYVIRKNGKIEQAQILRGRAKRVFPGDSVFVPADLSPDDFDITAFIADIATTLANIAAILVIVDNNN